MPALTFSSVMAYTQLFNLLCEKADDVYGGRLPVHVRCLIDEFANIGQIPKLEKLIATIRSREISACMILQAQSQLKALYKDNADTIIGNCDTLLFLGGKEKTTLKEMAELLGKETIDTYNTGESRGREVSHSLNYQKLGKDLMSVTSSPSWMEANVSCSCAASGRFCRTSTTSQVTPTTNICLIPIRRTPLTSKSTCHAS